jgi:head-tail adaptor
MTGAGKRSARPRFQQHSMDEHGDRLGDWEPGFQRWARIVVRTKGEAVLQSRLQGVQPVEVTLPSDSETTQITNAWRMVWKGDPYNIRSVAPDESRAEIVLLAEADQSDNG